MGLRTDRTSSTTLRRSTIYVEEIATTMNIAPNTPIVCSQTSARALNESCLGNCITADIPIKKQLEQEEAYA